MSSDTHQAFNCDECGRFTTEKSDGEIRVDYETNCVDGVLCVTCKPDYEAMALGMEELGRELEAKANE